MTIPINILQSMISRNKAKILFEECKIEILSDYLKYYRENGESNSYNREKKLLCKAKKELKALVAIQKALKKEVAEQLSYKRVRLTLEQLNNMIKDVS